MNPPTSVPTKRALTYGSLFAGIGGIDLGLDRAGMTCKWQVEKDEYCRRVLTKHWPDVPKYEDVRNVGKGNLEPVDLICGGFPCQDISHAGKRAGIVAGNRSGLWYEYARIIGELRPRFVVVENVAAIVSNGLDTVLAGLAAIGYDAEWQIIRAEDCGIPQARPRLFIVAFTPRPNSGSVFSQNAVHAIGNRARLHVSRGESSDPHNQDSGSRPVSLLGDAERPQVPNRERSGTNGRLSGGLDRYRAIGNSVCPQVAEFIGRRIVEADAALRSAA